MIGADLPVGTTVTPETLHHYVTALVVTNDVSARQIQLTKTQFYESKSYPTFTPAGPWLALVGAADLARLGSLRLTLSVNGEVRQDAMATDMIVTPARALTALSKFQPLAPGDLLLTGTPGGTALKAPPKAAEKLVGLLPPAVKWQLFFRRQAATSDTCATETWSRPASPARTASSISAPSAAPSPGRRHDRAHRCRAGVDLRAAGERRPRLA